MLSGSGYRRAFGFLLVFVVVAVATDDRVPTGIGAVAIGFVLACGVLVAGPVSGGAANPARALGPELVTLSFPAVYAYVLGPIIGDVLGALAYDRVIRPSTTPENWPDTTARRGSLNTGWKYSEHFLPRCFTDALAIKVHTT